LICTNCGATVDVPLFCGDRFCDICSGPRRTRFSRRVERIVKHLPKRNGYKWRFITLTIPTATRPAAALDTLYASFRRLRNRKLWKRKVAGGIVGAEVTRTWDKFHVHIHILAYSLYFPQADLARAWKSCSPGRIVDIRLIPSRNAAMYLTKYVTKSTLPAAFRPEVSEAFRNRRLYTVFGDCHSLKLKKEYHPTPCASCSNGNWVPLSMIERMPGYTVNSFAES